MAEILLVARLNDEAMEQGRKTVDMDPNFAIGHYYYCVISVEPHKKDNWKVVGEEPGRWFVGAWQSTKGYAARGEPGDPRGRNWGGISGMDSPSRPARAEGEKRFRSATRNP